MDAFQTIQDGLNAARTYIQDLGIAPQNPIVVGVGSGEYIEPAEVPSYVHLAGWDADETILTNEWCFPESACSRKPFHVATP